MLLDILGWFWIVTGVLFFFKPEWFRKRLAKKGVRKMRKIFFGIALLVGIFIIKATWGVPGVLAKIAMVFGVIAIIKAFLLLNGKATDHLLDWFEKQPVQYLRGFAILQIVVGAFFLFVK